MKNKIKLCCNCLWFEDNTELYTWHITLNFSTTCFHLTTVHLYMNSLLCESDNKGHFTENRVGGISPDRLITDNHSVDLNKCVMETFLPTTKWRHYWCFSPVRFSPSSSHLSESLFFKCFQHIVNILFHVMI